MEYWAAFFPHPFYISLCNTARQLSPICASLRRASRSLKVAGDNAAARQPRQQRHTALRVARLGYVLKAPSVDVDAGNSAGCAAWHCGVPAGCLQLPSLENLLLPPPAEEEAFLCCSIELSGISAMYLTNKQHALWHWTCFLSWSHV